MMRHICVAVHIALASANAADASELHFLVMGDWGGQGSSPYTTSEEVSTAKAMDAAAKDLSAKFALALGDNFYSSGVTSVDDSRFDKTFEQCFSGPSLQSSSGFKFHVVAGNHDHRGNVQAQIDYSSRSERWNFPSKYHSLKETAPDGAVVEIVLIDTVELSGNSQLNDEDTEFLLGSELPGPENLTAAQSQLQWLEKTLAASTAEYLIVAGHYPVYSIAEHGPTKQLQPSSFPYLRDHKVSAYLCGHDHNEQHIDVGDGVQYHVIGSAHKGDSSTAHKGTISSKQLKFHSASKGGFATVSVSKAGMIIKHLDASGNVLYTAPSIPPRGSVPAPTPAPAPAPSPTPSPAAWECHKNKVAKLGTDTNLRGTGSDRSSCTDACEATAGCIAIYWHKTDSHCHVLTGSFSHDDWAGKLSSNSEYDSCFRTVASEDLAV